MVRGMERCRGSPEGAAGLWSAIGGHPNHQAVTKAPGPGFPQAIKERLFEARRPDPEDQRRQIRLAPYQTKGANRYPTFSAKAAYAPPVAIVTRSALAFLGETDPTSAYRECPLLTSALRQQCQPIGLSACFAPAE
jgi:hypothetical protein